MSVPDPYVALALQPAFHGARNRDDVRTNIERINGLMEAARWMAETELPVRLIAIPEGALQGFPDEVLDMRHTDYLENVAIDIPGKETDLLAAKARQHKAYIIAQARGPDPKIPGYYFNWAFILSPDGELIHKAAKNQVFYKEPSATPHDVYDKWVEAHGDTLDSFFPVADTEIGRIGTLVCYEGGFPETARGLAMNGAEIIYRCAFPEPWVGRGVWEVQNRARALDNTCYVIAPNPGPYTLFPGMKDAVDLPGGDSMIIDYTGQILGRHQPASNSCTSAVFDLNALRTFRKQAGVGAWLKELRTEVYQRIYQEPVYPKNRLAETPVKHHADRWRQRQACAEALIARGVWKP